jgi:pyruvate dehydrogenase E2 component (dihydrolipoamide acetyltransferase)
MPTDLKLPLLGDVMQEGTVAEWLKPDGARVERGEPVYRLETDKVTFEVESPEAGYLKHLVDEGSVVAVGAMVGRIIKVAEEVSASPPAGLAAVLEADVQATPAARRLARKRGADLAALGSGRLLRERDIPDAAAPVAVSAGGGLTGRRKVIAERMHASLQQMAQLTISLEVDFTAARQLRTQLGQLWDDQARPSITELVMRAAMLALREHPALNATLDGEQLTQHGSVHLGLAVDADEGLIVPVLHDADQLPLRELSFQARELVGRARSGGLRLDELQGGTFTVTALGQLGIDFFTPIVNPPQIAILGIGRVFSKLVLNEGKVEERSAMYLNLSFDHRAVDGAPAARYLNAVKRLLELPAALVL